MTQKAPNRILLGTQNRELLEPGVPKVEYFKFSPTTSRYHRVMALARARGCRWQDIFRDALDSYLERFPCENF